MYILWCTLFQKAGDNPFDGVESSFGSFGLNKESDAPELPGQGNQWLQLNSSPMSARACNSGQSQASQRLSSQSGVSPRVSHESSKSTQQKKQAYRDMEGVGLHLHLKLKKKKSGFISSTLSPLFFRNDEMDVFLNYVYYTYNVLLITKRRSFFKLNFHLLVSAIGNLTLVNTIMFQITCTLDVGFLWFTYLYKSDQNQIHVNAFIP